jgi:hypothetical protein
VQQPTELTDVGAKRLAAAWSDAENAAHLLEALFEEVPHDLYSYQRYVKALCADASLGEMNLVYSLALQHERFKPTDKGNHCCPAPALSTTLLRGVR